MNMRSTIRHRVEQPLNRWDQLLQWMSQGPARAGYALIALTFGVMGGWAAVTPLARAVVSNGTVVVEDSRKVVQHLEGGVVAGVAVAEGQRVEKGDILVRLSPVQARANLDILRAQLWKEQALAARLEAEIAQADEIRYPFDLQVRSHSDAVRSAIREQEAQFVERAASMALRRRLVEARIEQIKAEQGGLAADRQSAQRQLASINEELIGLRDLRTKGLATLNRFQGIDRERIRFEGLLARNGADQARLNANIEEAQVQLLQHRQEFQEEASALLVETRNRLAELNQKLLVADDILARLDIRSPVTGAVQNLKVATIGQVIRPGEQLMEVVPDQSGLVIHVHLPVHEIEHVRVGQSTEIKFPGFHSRTLPMFEGQLRSISRDRLVEDRNQQPYYLGIVTMDSAGVPESYRSRLIAGMPADVVVVTGTRSALSYLTSPLTDAMISSFRN